MRRTDLAKLKKALSKVDSAIEILEELVELHQEWIESKNETTDGKFEETEKGEIENEHQYNIEEFKDALDTLQYDMQNLVDECE